MPATLAEGECRSANAAAALHGATRGAVVCYRHGGGSRPRGHEAATQAWLAQGLARLRNWDFEGDFDALRHRGRPVYFVPNDTLCPLDLSRTLRIGGEHDLFGGVVPFAFVATKVITHGLPHAGSAAPEGWSHDFAPKVERMVLPGFSAFSRDDVRVAGERLLRQGSVRAKDPCGIGGSGQFLITDGAQLEAWIRSMDPSALALAGMVLERNLQQVVTLSVGQVRVGGLLASYYGTQRLTPDNRGGQAYGGSTLTVVRGGFDALMRWVDRDETRLAIDQARLYHHAAFESFRGMFASRCNYDVAQGVDDSGRWCSGVLEQSWRMGGASGAELAALQAFADDPDLESVRASTTELYGANPVVPAGASVCFAGTDEEVGPLTKYALLERHADSR